METQVKLREQIKVTELRTNFENAINTIKEIVKENKYEVKVDGARFVDLSTIEMNFDNLSQNARKNLAKRIHFFNEKRSRKTMNILFLVFRKIGVISENVKVDISFKEKNINNLRATYNIMKTKTEEARLAFKKEKGDFYKEKLAQ